MSGFQLARVSRAAIESLGLKDFTQAAIVQFAVDPGDTPAETLTAILNQNSGPRELSVADVMAAMAIYPAATPRTEPLLVARVTLDSSAPKAQLLRHLKAAGQELRAFGHDVPSKLLTVEALVVQIDAIRKHAEKVL